MKTRVLLLRIAAASTTSLTTVATFAAEASAPSSSSPAVAPPKDPFAPFPPAPPSMAEPDTSYTYAEPRLRPTVPWILAQLVPSPALAFGRVNHTDVNGTTEPHTETSFGFRWQVTPLLWSWGTHRGLSPWRVLVVDPVARFSGSIESTVSLDYFLGYVGRLIVRPQIKAHFPLVQRGEYLSVSIGTSAYLYDGIPRVAYDVGAYTLFGLFGIELTASPSHDAVRTMTTFRIRYF